jgi:hypothetical protein
MKGAEIFFPQKQFKNKFSLGGNFPWNLGKIFCSLLLIFRQVAKFTPQKQSLLHTSQKFRLVLFEFMVIWGFLTPQ